MNKLIYEKPDMLIGGFIATQSVALNCGEGIVDLEVIELTDSMHVCDHKNCGHSIKRGLISVLIDGGRDTNNNGTISLFNTGECELCYEEFVNKNPSNPVLALGEYLVGNSSWSSDQHKMKIGDVKIPS